MVAIPDDAMQSTMPCLPIDVVAQEVVAEGLPHPCWSIEEEEVSLRPWACVPFQDGGICQSLTVVEGGFLLECKLLLF